MSELIDHDTWNYSLPKLPRASTIKLDAIYGVLPFDGVRNPSSRSSASHKIFMPYKTAANDWSPKVGICESGAEMAVALEALIRPDVYNVSFQPVTVALGDECGKARHYTHDVLITFKNGHRRLVFVRNGASLAKPRTTRDIDRVIKASKDDADDVIVVNASDYTRQRRENLFRMHHFVFQPDPEADDIVLHAARNLETLWHMRDLFPATPLGPDRVFRSCYRLVARDQMHANLDHVLWEHSRIEVS